MSLPSNVIEFSSKIKPDEIVIADLENGYCRLANELLDHMCQLDLSGSQFQVLSAVIRCTYGYNKKSDRTTNTYLVAITGLSEKAVRDALTVLTSRNIITCEKAGIMKVVSVNKVLSNWVVKSEKAANLRKGTEQMHRSKCTAELEQMHRSKCTNNPEQMLPEVGANAPTPKTTNQIQDQDLPKVPLADVVERIFMHWKTVMNKPNAKLTAERSKKITARLADGYTVDTIIRAIDGCAASDFHMGRKPDSPQQYNDFDLICRNGSKLESFAAMPLGQSSDKNWTQAMIDDAEVLF